LKTGVIRGNEIWNGSAFKLDGRNSYSPRGDFIYVSYDKIGDFERILASHQAAGNLGMGGTGQNGLQALSLEATV
jgi:hypothetical protein